MIKLIACVGKNYELGIDNHMPWSLKGDLKYFKETTEGQTVVMGKNTYLSIGRPLPNRRNIVITHGDIENDGVEVLHSIDDVNSIEEDVFIIGGASLYEYFLPYASEIYLTEVDAEFEADTYFPKFDKRAYNDETVGQMVEDGLEYSFHIYKRK